MIVPDIQLIANVVAIAPDGRVALTRYDVDDDRWWLPGTDLQPYEHPAEAARRVIADLGLTGEATPADRVVPGPARTARGVQLPLPDERGQPRIVVRPVPGPPTRLGAWESEVIRSVMTI